MYPSSALLSKNGNGDSSSLPIDELIEKADGFAGVFLGMCWTWQFCYKFTDTRILRLSDALL